MQGSQTEVNETVFAEVTYHAAYEPKRSARTARWQYIRHFDNRPNMVLQTRDPLLNGPVSLVEGDTSCRRTQTRQRD
jgi:hypothetical protein